MILRFDIQPVPAARPRVGRWGTYYPKKYTGFRKAMEAALKKVRVSKLSGPLHVTISIECVKPKSSKRKQTYPLGDVDNYAKGVLDSLNSVAYEDDDQVVALHVYKSYVKANPRISVVIDKITS